MWYWLFRGTLNIIFRLFFRLKVEGLASLPEKTNFIVAANHASFLDALVVCAAVPKRIYWIALRNIYHMPWLSWFMAFGGTLPTGNSSQKAVNLLMENRNIGLFPEGTRSHDGVLREFRRGAALFALRTGRPIVPCAIFGTYAALPKGVIFPRFRAITIKIGKPIYLLKEFTDIVDDIYLQDGIFRARNAIKEMLNAGK
ncbi:MAG: lysophospholipid acyltransferase family protein [Candidatus Omnitrophota bacterium]|nr:lysophospholipid acyltransferase family protein [Candidatus Omnitrophota bacterium]